MHSPASTTVVQTRSRILSPLARMFVTTVVVSLTFLVLYEGVHVKYNAATHLLDEMSFDLGNVRSVDHRQAISQLKQSIVERSEVLMREEKTLLDLFRVRDDVIRQSGNWLWFLDRNMRHRVDEVQLEINDQTRAVENVFEDIQHHWKQMKPHFGVFSRTFLVETLLSFATVFVDYFRLFFFHPWLPVGLIAFLVFPPLFFVVWMWFSLGIVLLPFVSLVWAGVCIFNFPFIVLQYDPTLVEFLTVYSTYVAAIGLFVLSVCEMSGLNRNTRVMVKVHTQ